MVTINSVGMTFAVQLDGDQIHGGVEILEYTKGRCLLRYSNDIRHEVIKVSVNMSGTNIDNETFMMGTYYYTEPNGAMAVPMRDALLWFVSKGVSVVTLGVNDYTSIDSTTVNDYLTATIGILPGISYNAVGAPKGKDVDDVIAMRPDVIMPPNVILNPLWGDGCTIESNYTLIDPTASWNHAPSGLLSNQIQVSESDRSLTLSDRDSDPIKTYSLSHVPDCADMLEVKWTSLTGAVRLHYFPIVSFIRGNGDSIEVDSLTDGYEVFKANHVAVRCRLTGLTRWGYYYYMDLLQASDPAAVIIAKGIRVGGYPVFIDGDGAETPDGNGFYNFEFVCNLQQYEP